jgi:hypothetical protein
LTWLAKFHAIHWNDDADTVLWRKQNILHERGGFWTTTTTTSSSSSMSSQWKSAITNNKIEQYLGSSSTSRAIRLGPRLQAICHALGSFLQQQTKKYGTLVHGDFKAANMMFREQQEEGDDDDGDDENLASSVAVVDFQFTGWGLCVEDVSYLLYPDVHCILMDNADDLLTVYHEQLVNQLMIHMKGGPSSISLEVVRRLYELVNLDLTRYWLTKGWEATTQGEAQLLFRIEKCIDSIDGGTILKDEEAYHKALQSYLDAG